MDSAVGVPKEFAEKDREDLTPMMARYVELCDQYDSELLLMHVGDFYKAFGEAAETVARLCELNLATREDSSGEYKMAGLRVESAETHLKTLLDAGFRVALAEQVEDPEMVSGVAERAVTRVITPGTLTEAELLNPVENNFVMSLTLDENPQGEEEYGLAFLDVSTGDFYTTSLTTRRALKDEVSRIGPTEVILGPGLRDETQAETQLLGHLDCAVTDFTDDAFREKPARQKIAEYFGQLTGSSGPASEIRASGALLAFAEYTRGGENDHLEHISVLTRYDPTEYMQLDDVALRGLEIFERRAEQSPSGATLVDVVDESVSALGSRTVRDWLRRPLLSADRIEDRLDAVEELVGDEFTRRTIRDFLTHVYDIERLNSRIVRERADARDIRSLYETLAILPELIEEIAGCDADLLVKLAENMPELQEIRETIDQSIKPDPASELTEGGIIKTGYDEELDELRATVEENETWIENLEATERERTGIDNLRVGHTEVHGYYIEVTNSQLDKVPEDYTRRQTLKQAERFYTPELKEREDEIIAATERANQREYDLFRRIRSEIADQAEALRTVAEELGRLDALASFAEIAAYNDYCRPELGPPGSGIHIEAGRHPVVEQTQESFVPNSTELDRESFLAIITGPNMSGKSTYLRQVALITLLTQAGSFVPANSARIGLTDRIYTRIGASDDITGGQSTFMVEMSEVADILDSATENSLILLDEVGRGTSTADGFALACAVTRFIHNQLEAMTLFATHHHELTQFIDRLPAAENYHFSAEQRPNEVVFHYNIEPGPATASYGIEVAQEAGLPSDVIEDAKTGLLTPDKVDQSLPNRTESNPSSTTVESGGSGAGGSVIDEMSSELQELLKEYEEADVADVIQDLDSVEIQELTPIEALNRLHELQEKLQN